jgi:chemotaxis protein CheD
LQYTPLIFIVNQFTEQHTMVVTSKSHAALPPFELLVQEFPKAETVMPGGLVSSNRLSANYIVRNITTGLTLVLQDKEAKVAGVAYVALPDSTFTSGTSSNEQATTASLPACYADVGIPELWNRLEALGASAERTQAILVGGSQLFTFGGGGGNPMNVGSRNVIMARTMLSRLNLTIAYTAVGGNKARNVIYSLSRGCTYIHTRGDDTVKV